GWRARILQLIHTAEIAIRIDKGAGKLFLHNLYYLRSLNAKDMIGDHKVALDKPAPFFVRYGQAERLARVRLSSETTHDGTDRWRLIFRPYREPDPIPLLELATRPQYS